MGFKIRQSRTHHWKKLATAYEQLIRLSHVTNATIMSANDQMKQVCGQLGVNESNDQSNGQMKPDCGQIVVNEFTNNNNHSTLLETDLRMEFVLVGTAPTVFVVLNKMIRCIDFSVKYVWPDI